MNVFVIAKFSMTYGSRPKIFTSGRWVLSKTRLCSVSLFARITFARTIRSMLAESEMASLTRFPLVIYSVFINTACATSKILILGNTMYNCYMSNSPAPTNFKNCSDGQIHSVLLLAEKRIDFTANDLSWVLESTISSIRPNSNTGHASSLSIEGDAKTSAEL